MFETMLQAFSNPQRLLWGALVSVLVFLLMGTVAALWPNPIFIRMTEAGGWEIGLLVILALLSGAYVIVRRPFCANGKASVGGILGFVGLACPVCNKILLLIFGGELLLTYFEPIRIYVAAAGALIVGWAVLRELRAQTPQPAL